MFQYCEKNIFYSFLGWPVTTKIEGKIIFYRILQIRWLQNQLLQGVQRIESHGEVFHEKSVLKHIRSATVVKSPEKYLRPRLVLVNFTEKLTLSQILLKVFDQM